MIWGVDGLIHVDEGDWPSIRAWSIGQTKPRAHIPIAANFEPVTVDAELRKRWRSELGFGSDETVIAFFGILYPHKGISELVDSVKDLHQRGRKVRLLVLGDFDRMLRGVGGWRKCWVIRSCAGSGGRGWRRSVGGCMPRICVRCRSIAGLRRIGAACWRRWIMGCRL